jgi:hypothetical protein
MNYILCDIDHTISNAFPRDNLIGGEGGWDAYHSASEADEPIDEMVRMINALQEQGFVIVAITARPEKWRQLTLSWLVRHNVRIDELLMRPEAEFRPAPEIKVDLAKKRFGEELNALVAFVLDDRDDVCAAFRTLGITALQVHAANGEG